MYERPALYLVFALIKAHVLTFLFTDRDAAITMNSVKTEITQSAVRSAITATAELLVFASDTQQLTQTTVTRSLNPTALHGTIRYLRP